jgi:hypothetical protein
MLFALPAAIAQGCNFPPLCWMFHLLFELIFKASKAWNALAAESYGFDVFWVNRLATLLKRLVKSQTTKALHLVKFGK